MMIVLARIGNILVRTLTSSTCVTVHTRHGLVGPAVGGTMAALSKALHVRGSCFNFLGNLQLQYWLFLFFIFVFVLVLLWLKKEREKKGSLELIGVRDFFVCGR